MGPGHQLFKVSQEAISASLLFLAGIFEFGEGLLHARNAHGEGGWLKELSVPRVGTVGYFCSASLEQKAPGVRSDRLSSVMATIKVFLRGTSNGS
ncbi:hypothetical protein AL049_22370 [Pseudomonas syringae pv. cerasicola]|nr:hypothetical protein AL049_22370 [Pseudomonas syringae pv. cerasicola]